MLSALLLHSLFSLMKPVRPKPDCKTEEATVLGFVPFLYARVRRLSFSLPSATHVCVCVRACYVISPELNEGTRKKARTELKFGARHKSGKHARRVAQVPLVLSHVHVCAPTWEQETCASFFFVCGFRSLAHLRISNPSRTPLPVADVHAHGSTRTTLWW